MKKTIFFASSLLLLAASCGNPTGYKIKGTTTVADGDTILLQQPTNRMFVTLDTAVVKDGKFTFEGDSVADINRCYAVDINTRGRFAEFILEPGTTEIVIDSVATVAKGSKDNEVYTTALKELRAGLDVLNKEAMDIRRDTTLTREQIMEKFQELSERQDEYVTPFYEKVKANIKNRAGELLFVNYKSYFDEDKVQELLKLLPEEVKKSNQRIAEMVKYYEDKQKTAEGQQYTDFEQQTPEGDTKKLSELMKGHKLTLIDFWASWCGPCRAEMPTMVKAYKEYKDKGLQIVGVSLDDNKEAWTKSLKSLNMTWPQISDLKGWENEAAKTYSVRAIPATVLVDSDGIIVKRGLRGEELLKMIDQMLK